MRLTQLPGETVSARPMERTAIAIRLIAPSREELARAVQTMQLRHGPHIAFNQIRSGRRGEWLVYGTLFV
jgi:hypothetical protein